jgi:hypothetical protein
MLTEHQEYRGMLSRFAVVSLQDLLPSYRQGDASETMDGWQMQLLRADAGINRRVRGVRATFLVGVPHVVTIWHSRDMALWEAQRNRKRRDLSATQTGKKKGKAKRLEEGGIHLGSVLRVASH